MHQIFLIDEILQEILHACMADGLRSLSQVARCMKAWEEPAKDLLWAHLPSAEPLLRLITALRKVDGIFILDGNIPLDLVTFHSYAGRVKKITHHDSIQVDASVAAMLSRLSNQTSGLLPDLTHVQMKGADCNTVRASLGVSAKLRDVDLRIGFKAQIPGTPHHGLCQYLQSVAHVERLNLRGLLCERLNEVIMGMSNLRSLTLHTGTSLAHPTLFAVLNFPQLVELNVHAGHFGTDLTTALPSILSPIKRLRIRACFAVVIDLLGALQHDILEEINIEAIDDASTPIPWNTLFSAVALRASASLRSLGVEHHIDLDEIPIDPDNTERDLTKYAISLDNTDLGSLYNLRRLTLDTTYPIKLMEDGLKDMNKHGRWPILEHLDLGAASLAALPMRALSLFSVFRRLGFLSAHVDISGTLGFPNMLGQVPSVRHLILSIQPKLVPDTVHQFVSAVFPNAKCVEWRECAALDC